jgi:hypothetical protein
MKLFGFVDDPKANVDSVKQDELHLIKGQTYSEEEGFAECHGSSGFLFCSTQVFEVSASIHTGLNPTVIGSALHALGRIEMADVSLIAELEMGTTSWLKYNGILPQRPRHRYTTQSWSCQK